MTTLGLAEALQGARDTKNVTLKVEALQKIPQDTKQILFGVFQLAYSDKIRWVLPESDPPFKPLEESSDAQGRLIMELKNMSYFIARVENNKIKPVQENIPMLKRENLFIQILSSIQPEDAELLLQVKKGEIKGVSKSVVSKAFPELGLQDANV
tara:strand:+ start:2063 stop:2524 length:462 start_codon:yes stop_codon:yes gene_type:complete